MAMETRAAAQSISEWVAVKMTLPVSSRIAPTARNRPLVRSTLTARWFGALGWNSA